MSLPITNTTQLGFLTNQADVSSLANTAFRFKVSYLRQAFTNAGTAYPAGYTTNTVGFSTIPHMVDLNSTNLIGVVMTVAVLDDQNQKIITANQLNAMAATLADPGDQQDPQSLWVGIINGTNGTPFYQAVSPNIPKSVAASVHVYQRIFYVNE